MKLTKIKIKKLARFHIIILIVLLIFALIEKINNITFNFSIYRRAFVIYFIFGNLFYTIIFKFFYKPKNLLILKTNLFILKTLVGIENKVYYFSSTFTIIFLIVLIKNILGQLT